MKCLIAGHGNDTSRGSAQACERASAGGCALALWRSGALGLWRSQALLQQSQVQVFLYHLSRRRAKLRPAAGLDGGHQAEMAFGNLQSAITRQPAQDIQAGGGVDGSSHAGAMPVTTSAIENDAGKTNSGIKSLV